MITTQESLYGAIKYLQTRFTGRPKLVNLEITKLCNAKCDFCDYWQTRHEERIYDYRPVIKLINPLVVVITGGEPMLRKDLPDIVRQVKESSYFIFTSMVTKGDLLTVDSRIARLPRPEARRLQGRPRSLGSSFRAHARPG